MARSRRRRGGFAFLLKLVNRFLLLLGIGFIAFLVWSQVDPDAEKNMTEVLNLIIFGVPVLLVFWIILGSRGGGRGPATHHDRDSHREDDWDNEYDDADYDDGGGDSGGDFGGDD